MSEIELLPSDMVQALLVQEAIGKIVESVTDLVKSRDAGHAAQHAAAVEAMPLRFGAAMRILDAHANANGSRADLEGRIEKALDDAVEAMRARCEAIAAERALGHQRRAADWAHMSMAKRAQIRRNEAECIRDDIAALAHGRGAETP
jgi:hypothetical protein